jgi:hypothetical protein
MFALSLNSLGSTIWPRSSTPSSASTRQQLMPAPPPPQQDAFESVFSIAKPPFTLFLIKLIIQHYQITLNIIIGRGAVNGYGIKKLRVIL